MGLSSLRSIRGRDSCESTPWHRPSNGQASNEIETGVYPKSPSAPDGAQERPNYWRENETAHTGACEYLSDSTKTSA